ncbi:MAG: hypothetical protein ACXAD7_26165 [Candidatus Kariarchaeaceae archaeon]
MAFLLISQIMPYSAAQVVAEDFEDDNLDDWEMSAYYWDANIVWWQKTTHELQIVDGALTAPPSSTFNNTEFAFHDTSIEYGTWSFDWILTDDGVAYDAFVFVMHDNVTFYNYSGFLEADLRFEGYAILMDFRSVDQEPKLRLLEYLGADASSLAVTQVEELLGDDIREEETLHFDITRNEDGVIKVYIDKERIISFTDSSTPKAEKLGWASWKGSTAIDNIVVDDEVIDPSEDEAPFLVLPFILSLAMIVIIKKKKW